MARRVFFSFHYERDAWRVGPVRNSWVTKPHREAAGFWDSAEWEEAKRKGEDSIKAWIDRQLQGTSVTVVLIGAETSNREYVKYELAQSWKRGNGILGVRIHKIRDSQGNTDNEGGYAFGAIFPSNYDAKQYFYERFNVYDWIDDDGYNNLGQWVELAAKQAGR